MNRKLRDLVVRAVEPVKGSRKLRFRGATENVARDGGILQGDGWQLEEYERNPVFLYAHQHEGLPLGRTTVSKEGGDLVFDVEFPDEGVHGFADTVFDLYRTGFMRAVSVGFRVRETRKPTQEERERGAEWVSTKHDLLELSAVPVGADPDALIVAARSLPKSAAEHLRRIGLDDFVALAREVESMKYRIEERDGKIVVALRDESEFDEGSSFVEHDFGDGIVAIVGTIDGEGAVQGLRFEGDYTRESAEEYLDDERVEALLAWRMDDEEEDEDSDEPRMGDDEEDEDEPRMGDEEDEDDEEPRSEQDSPERMEDEEEMDDEEERVYTRSDVVGILREAAGVLAQRADEIESEGDPASDEEDPDEEGAGEPRKAPSSASRGSDEVEDLYGIMEAARAYAGE